MKEYDPDGNPYKHNEEQAEAAKERKDPLETAPQLVRNWAELAKIPASETHRLEINIERGNGWLREKGNDSAIGKYLSTHTFYGSHHERSTQMLRECGFNVTLVNWDASPQATPTIARRDQVVLLPSGRKYVVNKDHELPEGAQVVANRPHEDGDYSYCCGSDWCRCMS